MTTIKYLTARGAIFAEAQPGQSVMEVAVSQVIEEIAGECGGVMMCATCHVQVDIETQTLFAPRSETEIEMLELAIVPPTKESRLGCQLIVSENMPNFSVIVPSAED